MTRKGDQNFDPAFEWIKTGIHRLKPVSPGHKKKEKSRTEKFCDIMDRTRPDQTRPD